MDGTSGDVIIEAVYENHPVKGELTIVKKGEVLDGFKDDFTYQTENLEGAEFEIYAAEDIYTADFQKDDNGNRILEYAAGTLVKTVTTDKDGKAVLKNLPLGSYKIVEKTAPDGFVLNSEAQIITFSYKDSYIFYINKLIKFYIYFTTDPSQVSTLALLSSSVNQVLVTTFASVKNLTPSLPNA